MGRSILAEDRTNFHDRSGRLEVLCLKRIPEQLLHLRGKCIIQDLQFHCTASTLNHLVMSMQILTVRVGPLALQEHRHDELELS